jgi:hypothetical protein
MASNYEKEPIFLLERTWDNNTKLPEKYKFQDTNTRDKAEVHIDSGTLGMEFFLQRTLPEFNQAGTKLDWSWSESFLEFENILGEGYCTTWLEVLTNHFPKSLENKPKATRELNAAIRRKTSIVRSPFSYVRYSGIRNLATSNTSTCSREVIILFERI